MKAGVLSIMVVALTVEAYAQTPINKTIPVSSGQEILMHFDYPELVKVTTWDKNEVSVGGTVSINSGENDDAFEILTSTSGATITIKNQIKDLKSLPQRVTVMDGLNKITFKSEAEFKKYQSQQGKGFDMVSHGVDMDIFIEVKVPRNVKTRVESVYGMVEVKSFAGPLSVDATYGGVDAALTEKATGTLTAETNYGEIYTNLDTKFGSKATNRDFYTNVTASPGNGPAYSFESKYGNVYLRKAAN
ncbi:MAG: hypothetical protein ABJA70_20000 [Chryseolinea sp.]